MQENQGQPLKTYHQILDEEIALGLSELRRPVGGLLLSAFSAGLDVGFSVLLMAVVLSLAEGVLSEPVVEILIANMYAVGFIFVVLGRSELFTEHTTLAVLPILDGRASLKALGRLWALVYAGNLVGGALFAVLAWEIGQALGVVKPEAFGQIARTLVGHPAGATFLSAVLAGWLMGLLTWLVAAGRETVSQIVIVWLITASIGLLHLHHSIVGTVEVLVGVFADQGITVGDYGHFLLWATLGNAVGGVVFVALIKYAHVVRGSDEARNQEESTE